MSRTEEQILIVADADAFRDWLRENGTVSDGVWLVLAKKGTTDPTSLTYAQALDEALCEGWIDRAKADGRWAAAYSGQASATVPDDLAAALAANPEASAMFSRLSGANRFAVLYRAETAKRPDTRARRVEQLVAMLARGETIHPQKPG